MHTEALKERARNLRKEGKSAGSIAKILGVVKSTAHLWTRDITLSQEQLLELRENTLRGARRNNSKPEFREKMRVWAKEHLAPERKYKEDDLLAALRNFYKEHGRIPVKREMASMYGVYRDRFGTWNNAIRKAGFEPNPVLFARHFTANDGHHCDSFTEKVIDDWLSDRQVPHERSVPYEGTKMTADFSFSMNVRLEFFGLSGVQKKYDRLVAIKKEICLERQILLIELYPKDVFPIERLSEALDADFLTWASTSTPKQSA